MSQITSLELSQITTLPQLESLRAAWSQLWQEHPEATPFQSPEWLLPWWHHLGGGALRVVTIRSAGKLVGIAPLFLHIWEGRRQLSPLGVSISDYTDLLILPPFVNIGAERVLEHLARQRTEWDVCVMPDVPAGASLLEVSIPAGLSACQEPSAVCPVIPLPKTVEEYYAGLSAHRRRQVQRGWRWLQRNGGAEIEKADSDSLEEFMSSLFRWHAARWRERAEPGMLALPELQAFHREVVAGLEPLGRLRLYGLRVRGGLRAVLYTFVKGRRAYAYLSGFDPSIAPATPVHLLMAYAIQEAIREGCCEYDLLRGREPYKYEWGARDRQSYQLIVNSGASQVDDASLSKSSSVDPHGRTNRTGTFGRR